MATQWELIKDRAKRIAWVDWFFTRFESYTSLANQYGWVVAAVGSVMLGAWQFVADSRLPGAIAVGLMSFVGIVLLFRIMRDPKGEGANRPDVPQSPPQDAPQSADGIHQSQAAFNETVHAELSRFAAARLLPACNAQIVLQEAILSQGNFPRFIEHIANNGLLHRDELRQFSLRLEQLQSLYESPPAELSAEELIEIIGRMEHDAYSLFCFQRDTLADAVGVDYRTNPTTAPLWQAWVSAHEAMVSAYEGIKTNRALHTAETHPSLPSLWRPVRPSRWGEAS